MCVAKYMNDLYLPTRNCTIRLLFFLLLKFCDLIKKHILTYIENATLGPFCLHTVLLIHEPDKSIFADIQFKT